MELNQFRDVDLVIDKANDNFIQRQFVSQGDYRGRTMTVQVTDNGLIGKVPGLMLNLRWRNQASGLADLSAFECIDDENSVFRIEYPVSMMTPGKVVANIQVIQNGQVTHLKPFEMTVQTLAGEMSGIVSQAEYGALVAVLADANKFRTDINILGDEKADKKALAQTNENIENLDSTKADKTALANTNQQVSGLISGKVDKGGASQVTMGMLSQEVKTAMTGGSVAVVGKDAVGPENIVDEGVNLKKLDPSISKNADGSRLNWVFGSTDTLTGEIIYRNASETSFNRMLSNMEYFEKGTIFKNEDRANYKIFLNFYTYPDKTYVKNIALVSVDKWVTEDKYYVVSVIAKIDDSTFTADEFDDLSRFMTFKISDFTETLQINKQVLDNKQVLNGADLVWLKKSINATTGELTGESTNRIASAMFPITKGSLVRLINSVELKFSYHLYDFETKEYISPGKGFLNPLYQFLADENYYVRIVMAYQNDAVISSDIQRFIEIEATPQDLLIIKSNLELEKIPLLENRDEFLLSESGVEILYGSTNSSTGEIVTGGFNRVRTQPFLASKNTELAFEKNDSWKFSINVYSYPDGDFVSNSRWYTKENFKIDQNSILVVVMANSDDSNVTDLYKFSDLVKIRTNFNQAKLMKEMDQRQIYTGTNFDWIYGSGNNLTGELNVGGNKRIRTNKFKVRKGTTLKALDPAFNTYVSVYPYDSLTGEYLADEVMKFNNTNTFYEVKGDREIAVVMAFKDGAVISDMADLTSLLEIRMVYDDFVPLIKRSTEEKQIINSGFSHYQETNFVSSLFWVGDKLWGIAPSADDNSADQLAYQYSFDDNGERTTISSFNHNWGHCNTSNYSQKSDRLIFGNGNINDETTNNAKFYVLENFTEKSKQARIDISECIAYDASLLGFSNEVAPSGSIALQPMFGSENDQQCNIVWAFWNDGNIKKLSKILLGLGDNDLGIGTFLEGKSENELNGTMKLINTIDGTAPYSDYECTQDATWFNGNIFEGLGHDGIFWNKIRLEERSSTYTEEQHQEVWYTADGTELGVVLNGIAIRDGQIFTALTVGNDISARKTYLASFKY